MAPAIMMTKIAGRRRVGEGVVEPHDLQLAASQEI